MYNGPDVGVKMDDVKNHLVGVDVVEVEMFKRFGYFTTGSGGHIRNMFLTSSDT